MNLGRALADDLRDLAVDLRAGGYTRATLDMLDRDLRRSVPSARGTTVVVEVGRGSDHPARINLVRRPLEPHRIAAALGVPIASLAPDLVGTVVFYAAQPAAFAQVAVDLAEALHVDAGDLDQQVALPESTIEPMIEGLQDYTPVDRALRVLINRGYGLAAARAELEERADRHHVDLVTAAQTVLRSA